MSSRFLAFLNLLLVAAFALCVGRLFFQSLDAPLSPDEGYNLEVVDNVAKGKGYASFGNRRFDAPWSLRSLPLEKIDLRHGGPDWAFDPRVTTGPAVLMPLAAVWGLSAQNITALRLFMWSYFVLVVLAVALLIPREEKSLLGVVGCCSILGTLFFGFHPGALIGELAATAYFLLGVAAAVSSRPLLAGCAWGMAIEAKSIFLPAVFLAVVIASVFRGRKVLVRWAFLTIGGLAIPGALWELYRFLSLGGMAAFLESWGQFMAFARQQTGVRVLGLLDKKLESLITLGPGALVALVCIFAAVLPFLPPTGKKEPGLRCNQVRLERMALLVAPGFGIITVWTLFSAQASYRQALPGFVLLYVGIVLFSNWWKHLVAWSTRGSVRFSPSLLVASAIYLLTFSFLLTWATKSVTFDYWAREKIQSQLAAAHALERSRAAAISPLVRWIEPFPVLSGLRMAPCPRPDQALVIALWAQMATGRSREYFRRWCGDTIAENQDVLICWPKPELLTTSTGDLKIRRWGPTEATVGAVPNRQPTGDGALWFELERPMPSKPILLLLADGEILGAVRWSAEGDWFSARLPRDVLKTPGERNLTVFDLCAGQELPIGLFTVRAW